jgi:hypothetical protein
MRALGALVALAIAATTGVAAGAATGLGAGDAEAATPLTARARLQGVFALAGRVTVADSIPGEQTGQTITRTWAFGSKCSSGPCSTVTLIRQRGTATDAVTLRKRQPGYYVGSGGFYAPLRCGQTTYPRGALVPFTIAVRVTAAVRSGNVVVATRVRATYTNSSRQNLTPCVGALGHDAASYHGHLVGPVPGSGGAGTGSGGAGTGSGP